MPLRSRSNGNQNSIAADLFLVHAPSVFDFRERNHVLFAYLSDSDSVNITSVYEMFPIGLFSIKQRLRERGFTAEIVNVASLMLMQPELDVAKLLSRMDVAVPSRAAGRDLSGDRAAGRHKGGFGCFATRIRKGRST